MAKDATKDHSGGGDPARSLALLWRKQTQAPVRNGRRDLSVDRIVAAAIEVADTDGLGALSMRRVADKLNVGTMSLYTYVPGKAELVDLMLDTVYADTPQPAPEVAEDNRRCWRARLEQVARRNWDLYHRHPWMLRVGVSRPPLGPNVMAKYDYELGTVAGIGLSETEMDTVLTLVIGHAETSARRAVEADGDGEGGVSEQQWWAAHSPVLTTLLDHTRYPLAASVVAAVGQAADDPQRVFEFGLARILDGVQALVDSRDGSTQA
ncbi:TetR/AcrR family transcriptional regulator [Actinokineospora globicatena]|uniref:TetR/AcrR family transcriptional regulator n=1 Tax=Actinokineospora globicatena TaxID=103729 RepID=UPI0020A3346A|nr:TetR/AcrR family transcriptional regulator [Actinokineospora globicatena]MCP2306305.1 transcriptional regulator, TetR family [Actinokineospora globicatena]GLW81730.1 TetR family transcriptional regulator [Actinokineospora globicatena]GLW88525.1 TetR family transcriptional regulator [Actinokineospora globicatena]